MDESRFSLQPDARGLLIWREPGTRYHAGNIREMDRYDGGGVMVRPGMAPELASPALPDLVPPQPLTGFGETIVASNPFDDTIPTTTTTVPNMPAPGLTHMSGPPMHAKPVPMSSGKFLARFLGQFTNAIENNPNLTPIDKSSYLKSLLVGSAYNVVAGFSITEENYKSAVDLLKNRFGRQDLVINAHMSKLLNMKQVKNAANVKKLRELYDSCKIQITNLNSLGVTAGSYGHLRCPVLLKLLPPEIALNVNHK
ncbi:hypothetical protein X975_07806, partial [Stegodyphus mimosarum]